MEFYGDQEIAVESTHVFNTSSSRASVRLVSNAFVLPAPPAPDVVVVEEQSVDSGE